jgi:SAM-dependent methyltransferase
MRAFEDHFSRRAEAYVRYRPTYPAELFSYLASISPNHHLAWDCGTGNGQAALGLVEYFDRVIATDASPEQIARAQPHERIDYKVARAENPGVAAGSIALCTVAIAVHWFDLEQFYAEIRRVLVPEGVLAVWCYSLPKIEPDVDAIIEEYCYGTLADYWPDRFRYVREEYQTLPFPFQELPVPGFTLQTSWDLNEMIGFLYSWSGTVNYEKRHGFSPVDLIRPELARAWGRMQERPCAWRLFLRVGRVQQGVRT